MRIDGVTSTPVPLGAAVPSLVRWGLTSDADLVFRTLVTFGPRTERTLAVELGLPGRRTAEALAELRESGAAVSTDDSRTTTRIWTARRPAAVVTMLRSRRLRLVDAPTRAQAHHGVVRALKTAGVAASLPVGTLPGLPGTFADDLRYLPSRELTRVRVAEVLGGPIREVLTMSNEQVIDAASARAGAPLDMDMHQRGVHMRLLAMPPADGDPLDISGHLINGTTFQRRESPAVPLKLILVDRRLALFPADPQDLERGYVEAGGAVARALTSLFDRHWTDAATAPQPSVAPIVLSDRERSLITLLAAGHTDHTAAQRLRISARSVTGIMRHLMDRLGVENRFQLGLALGSLRVVAPPSLTSDPSHDHDPES
ncbi:regulatory LuxR family protein [Pseudosporangium ferrugineum]|uniref:Regulatory LuxR family protein n=1 Tax=Pseudosporangium ferrugineum TaxID=439699 RepID=A0A2T0RMG9_9ACTN|nr:regulatory LuxR family protein [Pseudosporangium ferrugineum]